MNPAAHTDFINGSQNRMDSMRGRFGKVPFTITRLREFLSAELGGEEGLARCEYCQVPISILTLELDHRVPPSQGGSLGLDNLALSCAGCNQQKGEMSAPAFRALLMLVNGDEKFTAIGIARFSEIDRINLLGRLQSQLKLAMREQARLAAARRTKVTITPHQRRKSA